MLVTRQRKSLWFIYLLECSDGRLYTGISTDLHKRFALHCSGKGAKFTRSSKPLRMLAAKKCKDRSGASKLEWEIKQLKPVQKRAVASRWKAIKNLPTLHSAAKT